MFCWESGGQLEPQNRSNLKIESAEPGGIFPLMIQSLLSLTLPSFTLFLISRRWGPMIGAVLLIGVRWIACSYRGIGDFMG